MQVAPRGQLRESDGAVVARLIAIRPLDDGDHAQSSGDPTDFVYRTGKVVKGRPRLGRGRRLVVRSVRSDSSCGLSGRVGSRTRLFLSRDEGLWRAGSCQQTSTETMRRLYRASADGGAAYDHRCGSLGPAEERIERIRADRVSCKRARRVARAYLRFNEVRGWRCRTLKSGRQLCTKRCLRVSFSLVGRGIAA